MLTSISRWRWIHLRVLAGAALALTGVLGQAAAWGQSESQLPQVPATVVPSPGVPSPVPVNSHPGQGSAEPVPLPAPVERVDETVRYLSLQECRHIALNDQPAVAAARSSLAAAEARYKAVCHLSGLSFLERDLKIRKQQACMGVQVANAAVVQAEAEALYAVTRNYLTVLYAREQMAVTDDLISKLNDMRKDLDNLKELLGDKLEKALIMRETHEAKRESYLNFVSSRKAETAEGEKRALAVLREAMGHAGDCQIDVLGRDMPDLPVSADCKGIVALALARRGELVQAELGAAVAAKEIDAQKTTSWISKKTFASASDIHAKLIPVTEADGDYRPGGLAPEMPVFMIGCKKDRVEQACDLAARASSVADKTRNLIILEAENHFLKLQGDLERLQYLRKAFKLAEEDRDALRTALKNAGIQKPVDLDKVFDAGSYAAQLHANRNETHYHFLLDLAALERITAGGFDPGFDACDKR